MKLEKISIPVQKQPLLGGPAVKVGGKLVVLLRWFVSSSVLAS